MKKISFILLLLIVVLVFPKQAKAMEESRYNLIDMNQISYDEERDVFFSRQKISLLKDQTYTLVASTNFFGTVTENNPEALYNKEIGASFINEEDTALNISVILTVASTGLHYSSFTPNEDCYLEITDFLTKGYTLETLPKKEIILFKGSKEEFVGFRENEYIDNYEKIGSSINIYTSYDNPIKTEDITSKIRVYDNCGGFNSNLTLLEDNYDNNNQIGVYTIKYSSKDNSNNTSELIVNVNVVDALAPEINGPDEILWDCYDASPAPEVILMQYTANDELDGDLSKKIEVASTSLTMYQIGKVRNYEVLLQVKDNSGNICQKLVIIKASDITNPTLTLTDLEIKLSELGQIAFGSFFQQAIVSVGDNSGKYQVEINGQEVIDNMGFTGAYNVVFVVSDESGNKTEKTAKITIIDDLAPEFYMHVDLFTTTTNNVYSLEKIKETISQSLYNDGILYDEINLISCDYFQNEKTPGKYSVKYAYSYKGEINYMIGSIVVEQPQTPSYYWLLIILIVPALILGYKLNKKRKNL